MKTSTRFITALFGLSFSFAACLAVSSCWQDPILIETYGTSFPELSLQGIAGLLADLPIGTAQMGEVRDAVLASAENGYDEEYMMADLFASPGSGVGDGVAARSAGASGIAYSRPMRDLIRERLSSAASTRGAGGEIRAGASADGDAVDRYIAALGASGMQIYWPYSNSWDGESLPVITFDPESDADCNKGYEIVVNEDGTRTAREVIVDEQMARSRPVWVVNSNDDSGFVSLEQLRKSDPDWGQGGRIIVGTRAGGGSGAGGGSEAGGGNSGTRAGGDIRTLVLSEFTMKYHYESWFRGASEFWVKCGAASGFHANTEAELKLYTPTVTDFMISVKRDQIGIPQTFDAVMISDFSDQVEDFAFMILEDDGGTRTNWKVDTTVKIKSKSYGVTVDLPFNDRDDIVWRGSLSSRYFEKYSGETAHFGGVDLVFALL